MIASAIFSYSFLSAPLRAPDLVTAFNSSSTSLVVKWSHLLDGDFQGKPIGYNITYYAAETVGDKNVVNVNYTTNITALSNLTVYTMYVINVSAVSSGGTGPANTVKARTGAKGTHVLKLLHLYHSPPVSKKDGARQTRVS